MKKHTKKTSSGKSLAARLSLLALTIIITGCSGYRSTVKSALYSAYQPTIHLGVQPSTNLYGRALCPPSTATPRSTDQTVTADAQVNAPIILCAEQINLMIFGGAATSNSVLSDLQVPLTGAP